MSYNYSDIEPYLQLDSPKDIRFMLWIWLMLLNVFGFGVIVVVEVSYLKHSFTSPTIIVPLILTALFDLWAFIIFLNPAKRQKVYVLFVGIFGVYLSVTHLFIFCTAALKLLQLSFLWVIITVILYLTVGVTWLFYVIGKMKSGEMYKNRRRQGYCIAANAAFLGLIGGRLLKELTEGHDHIGLCIVSLLMAFAMSFLSFHIHRYYVISEFEREKGSYQWKS